MHDKKCEKCLLSMFDKVESNVKLLGYSSWWHLTGLDLTVSNNYI